MMMHARAVATPMLDAGRVAEALETIEVGIDGIRDFLDEYQQGHRAAECAELVTLEHWRDELLAKEENLAAAKPATVVQVLRRKLDEAVAAEQFEEAARLRDEIKRLAQ
jgi:ribosomal 50S subunit-associated protein YjgA (DUF615 family)